MKYPPLTRFLAHVRDVLLYLAPFSLRSESGIQIKIYDRTQIRLYEQIFVANVFTLGSVSTLGVRAGGVIFDLGANCGFFTVRALDFFPKAQIYAFEPNGDCISKLNETLILNNLTNNVKVFNVAVGESSGVGTFYQNRSSISSSLVKEKVLRRRLSKKSQIKVISLDDFCLTHGITVIDILKIDVEGFENQVLRGARKILAATRMIFVEIHPPFASITSIEQILLPLGFVRRIDLERLQITATDLVYMKLCADQIAPPRHAE